MIAQQVKFKEDGSEKPIGGILVDDTYIICGCCGGIFEKDEVEILEEYSTWVDISYEIKGE